MLSQLGHTFVLLSLLTAAYSVVSTVVAYRVPAGSRAQWLESSHNSVFAVWALVTGACVLLMSAFLTNNFSLSYVWENSSRAQPLPFKVSALWGGQAGSLLFWTFILASYALIVSRSGRKTGELLSPAAAATISIVTAFFAGLVAFHANPFTQMEGQVPQDGRGMTPLLQNYWMQIHPPTLYIGYVGCTVPFAFAVSALLHRKFDEAWVALIRRWVLVTWVVLTVGIVLGGVWAYETLGWGGYWAWDPVENASLLPWLAATAFLHSIMLQGRRGLLKNWNIALVTLTFLLSIFGTFLTRSGVVQSVHSFAESGIGGYFLSFLGVAVVATLALILWRRSELHSDAKIESALSREGAFMMNNWLLLGATFAVLWGTVFPTFSESLGSGRVAVGQEYFNAVMAPLGLGLLALTGIGPLLPWRRATWASVWKAIKIPALWALALSPIFWMLSQYRTGAATSFALSLFVAFAILSEFKRGIQALRQRGDSTFEAAENLVVFNPARYGGYIVHLGVALMFVGLTGSSVFKIEKDPITLKRGEELRIGEYRVRLDSLGRPEKMPDNLQDQVAANLTVTDLVGRPITSQNAPMTPHIDFFKNAATAEQPPVDENMQRASRPAIRSTPANDLYLVLTGYDTKEHTAEIKAYLNPLVMWIWISVGFFVIGTLIALIPPRRRDVSGGSGMNASAPRAAQREKDLVA